MALEQYFLSTHWLWALAALIPLIILYLLRPKPQKQTIPSLMFLLSDKKRKRLHGFFKRFVPNTLFLIQFLLILLLAIALLEPYTQQPLIQSAQQTIIVLDNSASMHVQDSTGMRYQQIRQQLPDYIGQSNTIILAGASSEVVLEDASSRQVQSFLNSWTPSHQPTHLRVALQQALSRVDANTAVVIASDFIDTEPQAGIQESLSELRARAGDVLLIQVGEENTNNIGIIDVQTSDTTTTITVKNYDDQTRTTRGCVAGVCQEFTLDEREQQDWTFRTPPGISEVSLESNDAFSIDDTAYISAEEQTTLSVLVITNSDWSQNSLSQVLQALDETTPLNIDVTINNPPNIPEINHDLIIFTDINPSQVVERPIRTVEERVRSGQSAAIIMDQESLFALPYNELLRINYQESGQATRVINTNEYRQFVGFEYGSTPTHNIVQTTGPTRVLATNDQENPLIAISNLDSGRVLYYGLPQTASFQASPDYPLFWKNALDMTLQRLSASQRTFDTQTRLSGVSQATTPSGERVSGNFLLEHTGVYQTNNGAFSANLVNAAESDISIRENHQRFSALDTGDAPTQNQPLTTYVIMLALAILLIEIFYLKYRGEL